MQVLNTASFVLIDKELPYILLEVKRKIQIPYVRHKDLRTRLFYSYSLNRMCHEYYMGRDEWKS